MTSNGMFASADQMPTLDEEVTETAKAADAEGANGPVEQEDLWEALKKVYDPEIPVNIVDLGPSTRSSQRTCRRRPQDRDADDAHRTGLWHGPS